MARKHIRVRGISVGTIAVLALTLATLLTGGWIFLRISGDMGQIALDPKLLSEPLAVLARGVIDTNPESSALSQAAAPTQDNPAYIVPPSPTATPQPTPPPIRTLSIAAVGQIATGQELRASALDKASGVYDFAPVLTPVSSALSGADLSIATLRTSLSPDSSTFDGSCGPSALAAGLKQSGISLLNLATDRLLDHGMAGVSATRDALQSAGIGSAGGYRTAEERQAAPIREIQGVQVGILSYTTSISAAGKKAASDSEISIATRLLSAEAAAADIAALRSRGAEIVIVLAHWGSRGDTKPTKETHALADALAEAGADVILGTNPTSVHEIERRTVQGVDGQTREVFIAYSLGNFLMDDSRDTADITGMILRLDLEWNAQTKRASIRDAWYMPTWIMRYKGNSGVNLFRVVPAGVSQKPENMTDGVYNNMKKAYQSLSQKLGNQAARPRAE